MRFQGAVIKEQGVTFAIVIVKKYVVDDKDEANKATRAFQSLFPGIPIALMAQDSRGVPTYYGRKDIAKFMANISLSAVTWNEYSTS